MKKIKSIRLKKINYKQDSYDDIKHIIFLLIDKIHIRKRKEMYIEMLDEI